MPYDRSRSDFWHSQLIAGPKGKPVNLHGRTVGVLIAAGADDIDHIRRLGRGFFKKQPNCGQPTLRELDKLVDWWTPAEQSAD